MEDRTAGFARSREKNGELLDVNSCRLYGLEQIKAVSDRRSSCSLRIENRESRIENSEFSIRKPEIRSRDRERVGGRGLRAGLGRVGSEVWSLGFWVWSCRTLRHSAVQQNAATSIRRRCGDRRPPRIPPLYYTCFRTLPGAFGWNKSSQQSAISGQAEGRAWRGLGERTWRSGTIAATGRSRRGR